VDKYSWCVSIFNTHHIDKLRRSSFIFRQQFW